MNFKWNKVTNQWHKQLEMLQIELFFEFFSVPQGMLVDAYSWSFTHKCFSIQHSPLCFIIVLFPRRLPVLLLLFHPSWWICTSEKNPTAWFLPRWQTCVLRLDHFQLQVETHKTEHSFDIGGSLSPPKEHLAEASHRIQFSEQESLVPT